MTLGLNKVIYCYVQFDIVTLKVVDFFLLYSWSAISTLKEFIMQWSFLVFQIMNHVEIDMIVFTLEFIISYS